MLKHTLACLFALAFLPWFASTTVADEEPEFAHPTSEWMTWTLKDAAGDEIDLDDYTGSTYVVVFSANNEDSCTMMHDLAEYVRAHPGKADSILAMCCDDTGQKALKRHLRQEEWTKRVAEWNAEQEAAREAAQQTGEEFAPQEMPDFLQQIIDELDDEDDLATLMAYHFPFNAGWRCEGMWDWLSERMDGSATAPRILKFNSSGVETHEWSAPFDLPQLMGN